VFETGKYKGFSAIIKTATQKMALLHAAQTLGFLRSPPRIKDV
jgi:hypothetical protein